MKNCGTEINLTIKEIKSMILVTGEYHAVPYLCENCENLGSQEAYGNETCRGKE